MSSSTPDTVVLTASCVCGAIKLILCGLPKSTYICHCFNCRKLTGTLFATQISYDQDQVSLLDPDNLLHKYSFEHPDHPDPKTAPAPNSAWCGKCGCPVWCDLGGYMGMWYIIRYGLLDLEEDGKAWQILEGIPADDSEQSKAFRPRMEAFCKRKPIWARDWKVEGAKQKNEMTN